MSQAPVPARTGLTLRALLDSVQNHPSSLAADSRVRAARGSRVTAGTFGNPTLSYLVDQTPFPGGQPLVGMEREATTTATLPLEFLYQRGPRVARANAELRAAQSDAALAKQRLGLEAASAYYRVAIAQVQVATTRDLLRWLDTLVVYTDGEAILAVAPRPRLAWRSFAPARPDPPGLQIVSGIAFRFGVGGWRAPAGVFAYLSFEYAFRHAARVTAT